MGHFRGHLHLDPLDLDALGVGGDVQRGLHVVGDLLPLGQQLVQTLGPQHIPTHSVCFMARLLGLNST